MLSRVTLSLYGTTPRFSILSRVYFFFALFPSPFFGGPFPLLFIRSSFTFRLLSSGSSNSMSIFRIPSGYHDVNRGPTNAFLRVFSPWVRSCRSVRFGIFSPRPGLSFLVRRGNRRHRSFDLAIYLAFLLLSRLLCFTL